MPRLDFGLIAVVFLIGSAVAVTAEQPEISFCQPPFVPPLVVKDLLSWSSDSGDQVVAINLTDSSDSNRYSGAVEVSTGGRPPRHPQVTTTETYGEGDQKTTETIGYEYVGLTSSGVHVLHAWEWGDGTMVAHGLLLVSIDEDRGIAQDPPSTEGGIGNRDAALRFTRPRLLVRKLAELALGDRWEGDLRVDGNRILVGRDQGWFGQGQAGEPTSPYNRRDVVLSLEGAPARPPVLRACP